MLYSSFGGVEMWFRGGNKVKEGMEGGWTGAG